MRFKELFLLFALLVLLDCHFCKVTVRKNGRRGKTLQLNTLDFIRKNKHILERILKEFAKKRNAQMSETNLAVTSGVNLTVEMSGIDNITSQVDMLGSEVVSTFITSENGTVLNEIDDKVNNHSITVVHEFDDEFFQEDEYTFQSKAEHKGHYVYVRIDTNRTSKMIAKPDLGTLRAGTTSEYLICTEQSWEDDETSYIDTNMALKNCPSIGTCCNGDPHETDIDSLNFPNLFTSTPKGSDIIVVNYHTAHLELWFENCEMIMESSGCVAHTFLSSGIWYSLLADNKTFPIVHFIIPRIKRNANCVLRLCGLTKGRRLNNLGWELKRHTVTARLFKRPEDADKIQVGRKLLSYSTKVPLQGYRWDNICNTKNQLIPHKRSRLHHHLRSVAGKKKTYCNNTLITDHQLTSLHGCYQVADYKTYFQCPGLEHNKNGTKEDVNCTLSHNLSNCDKGLCFDVMMNGTGIVTVAGEKWTVNRQCTHKCTFYMQPYEEVSVKCPDGKMHKIVSNLVDHNCPLVDLTNGMSLYICRATARPKTMFVLSVWLIVGLPALVLTLTLMRWLIALTCKTFTYVCRLKDRKKGNCQYCGTFVPSCFEWQRHTHCNVGECPFCKKRFSVQGLISHAKFCLDKEECLRKDEDAVNELRTPRLLLLLGYYSAKGRKGFSKTVWLIVLLLLVGMIIQPVTGIKNVQLQDGLWSDELEGVAHCTEDCYILENKCYCEKEKDETEKNIVFKSRSLMSTLEHVQKAKEYTADVQAPWGSVHIPSTYHPVYSPSSIKMAWTSEEKDDSGKIVLSGKATGHLQLSPHTGLSFLIQSEKSSETRLLNINIIDFTQIYQTRFEYLTGDRKVGDWMHGTCSGPCPDKCGCTSPTCLHTDWPGSRNWHCNPTWCWRMDSGCTCCGLDIVEPFQKWAVSKWTSTYEGTGYIACVEFSKDRRHCDVISEGTAITYGPYKVQLSEVTNVVKSIPTEFALIHHVDDKSNLDLLATKALIGSELLCKLQSCAHGGPGDYQIFDLKAITSNKADSEFYIMPPEAVKKLKHSWMSWNGVVQRYTCSVGHWPTCSASGVVESNTDAFNNIMQVSRNISDDFFFHSLHTTLKTSVPTLELEARPKKGGGSIEVYIEVDKLMLEPKEAELTRIDFKVHECSGCFGCNTGFTCLGSLLQEGAEELGMHIKSNTEHTVVESSTILTHTHNGTGFEIKGFTPLDIKTICLEVAEGRLCRTCPQPVTACTSIQLEPPKQLLLENRSTLKATQVDKCSSWLSCWMGSAKNFFSSVSSMFGNIFGSFFTGLLVTILSIGIPILLIFFKDYLPNPFFFCKKGRALMKKRKGNTPYDKLPLILQDSNDLDPDDLRHMLRKTKRQ
uniref:M polyprotein n=1 Tax=Orthonairovirus bushkeyense TaxID=3052510 RepID=A0A7D9MVM6_9VIRU|nr:polyprotein [Orthonairovirus bushkeyense]